MADIAAVRHRIERAIRRHAHYVSKPHFSPRDLLVMALLMADKPQTFEYICEWITINFEHHRAAIHGGRPWPEYSHLRRPVIPSASLKQGLEIACNSYEIPIDSGRNESGSVVLSLPLARCSRSLLRSTGLVPMDTDQFFPFFKLPTEPRMVIYEVTFRSPQATVLPYHNMSRPRISRAMPPSPLSPGTRSHQEIFTLAMRRSHSSNVSRCFRTIRVADILAPLLTCRQLYQEAMPVFYSINRFHLPRHLNLLRPLTETASDRLQHFKHVSISLFPNPAPDSGLELLTHLTNLRKIGIFANETTWADIVEKSSSGRVMAHERPRMNINCQRIATLRRVKADEVIFHKCPTLEQMLKHEMTRPSGGKVAAIEGRVSRAESQE